MENRAKYIHFSFAKEQNLVLNLYTIIIHSVNNEMIAAIDVGSSRIKAMIATFSESGSMRVLGVGTIPSHGIRR